MLTELIERVNGVAGVHVGRASRTIFGVALLNSRSRNRSRSGRGHRLYPAKTMREAEPILNGARVFMDHEERAADGQVRTVKELLGAVENVRTEERADGTATSRGDVKVLVGEHGDKLLDIAERMPGIAGFSINAKGMVRDVDGDDVVEQITTADSIDLVTKPGATRSIFESLEESDGAGHMSLSEVVAAARGERYVPATDDEERRRIIEAVRG